MIRTSTKAVLALATAGVVAVSTPVAALPAAASPMAEAMVWHHGDRGHRHGGYDRYNGGYGYNGYNGYDDGYNDYRRYDEPVYRNTRTWRGEDGRYYCRRSDGTTGLLIGGAAGALLGREVAGRYGDRTLGAILGAAGGALIGRQIDRNGSRCR